jgi:hypothetical protein
MPGSFFRRCFGRWWRHASDTASGQWCLVGGTMDEEPPVGPPSHQDERQPDHDPIQDAARTCPGSGSRLCAWHDGLHRDPLPVCVLTHDDRRGDGNRDAGAGRGVRRLDGGRRAGCGSAEHHKDAHHYHPRRPRLEVRSAHGIPFPHELRPNSSVVSLGVLTFMGGAAGDACHSPRKSTAAMSAGAYGRRRSAQPADPRDPQGRPRLRRSG